MTDHVMIGRMPHATAAHGIAGRGTEPASTPLHIHLPLGEVMGKQLRGSAIAMALTCVTAFVALGYDHRGEDDGTGFSDGFVTGYGKHCQLRSTRNEARWQDAGYTRAYADGLAMGAKACDNERSSRNAPIPSHTAVAQLGAR